MQSLLRIITLVLAVSISLASAWISPHQQAQLSSFQNQKKQRSFLFSTEKETLVDATTDTTDNYDYMVPDDAVIHIQPNAMRRLRELRDQRQSSSSPLLLRMGVRSGGCSGMSYVMDFGSPESIQEDDQVDTYETENIQCVVGACIMSNRCCKGLRI
jgi:Fe-S cluster assembly iron-binding protein IscA